MDCASRLLELNLGSQHVETVEHEGVIEIITGMLSRSMGLVADSLDMLADASVYGHSLWAVGSTVVRKKSVARFSGIIQI
jgi:hypothetical protein